MDELGIVETSKVQEEAPAAKPALPTTYDELDSDDLYVRYGAWLCLSEQWIFYCSLNNIP